MVVAFKGALSIFKEGKVVVIVYYWLIDFRAISLRVLSSEKRKIAKYTLQENCKIVNS